VRLALPLSAWLFPCRDPVAQCVAPASCQSAPLAAPHSQVKISSSLYESILPLVRTQVESQVRRRPLHGPIQGGDRLTTLPWATQIKVRDLSRAAVSVTPSEYGSWSEARSGERLCIPRPTPSVRSLPTHDAHASLYRMRRPDGRGQGTLAHALLPCVPALTPTLARLAAAAQGAADARGGGGAQRDGGGPDPGDLRQEGEGAGERDRPPAARDAPGDGGALQRERRRTRTRPPHSHSPTYPLPPSLAPNAIPLLAQFLSK